MVNYLRKKKRILVKIEIAKNELRELYVRACLNPPPLRKATPNDITIGNLIWYEYGDFLDSSSGEVASDFIFFEIASVLNPHDEFKAFIETNGSQRGLYGALVEKMK